VIGLIKVSISPEILSGIKLIPKKRLTKKIPTRIAIIIETMFFGIFLPAAQGIFTKGRVVERPGKSNSSFTCLFFYI